MTKKTAKAEEEKLVLPDWIKPDSWKAFEAMRKKIKKPMSVRAAKMVITALGHLRAGGHEPNLVLDQSEYHNWQDVYPLKEDWLRRMGLNRDGTPRTQQQQTRQSSSGRPLGEF
jgi:hypothetical protein